MGTATAPVTCAADLDGLCALRDRISDLRTDLRCCVSGDLRADIAVTGHAELSRALDRFATGCGDGIARVCDKLDQCLAGIDNAVETCRAADSTLVTALSGTAETP